MYDFIKKNTFKPFFPAGQREIVCRENLNLIKFNNP